MNGDDRYDKLRQEVRYLMDRQEILDCVSRHARGHDRLDADLLTDAYHEDGVDEHGSTVNPASSYAQWANAVHSGAAELHTRAS